MSHDTLSDVLRSVRLRSALYYYVCCRGDWVAEAPPSAEIAAAVMPGAERVIEYHVVTEGECWAAVVGQPLIKLKRGDIILLPHGDAHVISNAPGMRADPHTSTYFEMQHYHRPFRVAYDGKAAPQFTPNANGFETSPDRIPSTTLVCGFIGCDTRPFNPLLATLPRLLRVPHAYGTLSETFVNLAAAESIDKRPGSEALLERLSEMMLVDAVRRHVDAMPEPSTGWLAGLRDRFVGRALALLHENPAADWNIDDLSRQVGLSRSALHERFVDLIGHPPMQYLTNWRMQLASRRLRDTQSSVAAIAFEVGYDSEAAFARAFKRLVGAPPGAWRRLQSGLDSSAADAAGETSPSNASTDGGRRLPSAP